MPRRFRSEEETDAEDIESVSRTANSTQYLARVRRFAENVPRCALTELLRGPVIFAVAHEYPCSLHAWLAASRRRSTRMFLWFGQGCSRNRMRTNVDVSMDCAWMLR